MTNISKMSGGFIKISLIMIVIITISIVTGFFFGYYYKKLSQKKTKEHFDLLSSG
jgi:hypothetical protein